MVETRLREKRRAQEGEGDLARARFSQESARVFESRLDTVVQHGTDLPQHMNTDTLG